MCSYIKLLTLVYYQSAVRLFIFNSFSVVKTPLLCEIIVLMIDNTSFYLSSLFECQLVSQFDYIGQRQGEAVNECCILK